MEKVKVRVKAKIAEGKVGSEISLEKEKAILYQKRGRVDIVSFDKPEDITSDSIQSEEVPEEAPKKEPKVVAKEAPKVVSKPKPVAKKAKHKR